MSNADINPPRAFLDAHAEYAQLLTNSRVADLFAQNERIAVEAKRTYTILGVFSLAAALITITSLIVALTLNASLRENGDFAFVFGVLGALGIAAQLALLASPLKRRWLGARFAAERLRGMKFQAFAHAIAAGANHAGAADAYTTNALASLSIELEKPIAAMHEFDAERILEPSPQPRAPVEPAQLAEFKEMYKALRLDYQINHAQHRIGQIIEERRLPAAASEISFWLAVALGYIDLILTSAGGEQMANLRHFLTLFFFVLSAILFVLERGRAHNAALERYEDYARALMRVSGGLDRADTVEEVIGCVREGERAAMRELKAFCREAEKSTYLY